MRWNTMRGSRRRIQGLVLHFGKAVRRRNPLDLSSNVLYLFSSVKRG
jgi:hypothetical protein